MLFLAFNFGGDGAAGWGIPMATDVAFALGVLALLGIAGPGRAEGAPARPGDRRRRRRHHRHRRLLLRRPRRPLGCAAAAGWSLVVVLRRAGSATCRSTWPWAPAIWLATFESGVHATIAGVALGLLTPARPLLPEVDADRIADELSADHAVTAAEVRDISFRVRESVPVTERLQDLLHPWTSYLIVPLFASPTPESPSPPTRLGDAATSPVAVGVLVGLVVGKLVGVAGAIALAVRSASVDCPKGSPPGTSSGMAAVAGIGFTVSIFVAGLAFNDPVLGDQATIGVLAASIRAAGAGSAILLTGEGRKR